MKKILTEEKGYLACIGVKKETNTEELEEMNTTADQNWMIVKGNIIGSKVAEYVKKRRRKAV